MNKKEDIIRVLKEEQKGLKKGQVKPLTTSVIAMKIKSNHPQTLLYLKELEKEGKIRLIFETNNGFKYWGLNK